ncbi:ParB/RepB/Spo0J family partition protein [Streptomyces sp. TLI_105]|uniref:ParB/RepB/Spo0J family partition protein n=1 Tax=Streptomyces sp. TLI_105 TaxID=1881019 RepID=UPI0008949DB6|nr:ParB/RepB/Spo0J family partition protein [Streptomyces sp. TLI_105]SEE61902.1 ParB family protein [Streptomyces sp. TLI_105]
MSKAKNLGAGASFAQARPISARRAAIGAATAAPTEGVPDPTELSLSLISQNPDNPREELRDLEGLADSIREIGLVNSITVATVDSYLAERPDRADDVDEGARYIVVDGHRRLEAARLAGADTIRVSVNNKLVATDEALLEAAFVANVHRDDMNPIEQAHALKKLVEFYGSQNKAAKRLGIGQSTISSKLSILDLDPALQADLIEGRRTIEHVRNLSKLPPEEQRAKADARAEAAEQKAAAKRDLSRRDNPSASQAPNPSENGTSDGADAGLSRRDNPGPSERRPLTDEVPAPRSATESPATSPAQSSVSDPVTELPSPNGGAAVTEITALERPAASQNMSVSRAQPVPTVPLHDGAALMDLAFDGLTPGQRSAFIQRYFKRSTGVGAVVADLRADLERPARASLAEILQQVAAGLLEEK